MAQMRKQGFLFGDQEAIGALSEWHQNLVDPLGDRGARAELRRAKSAHEVGITRAFNSLRRELERKGWSPSPLRLAVIAGIAAHIDMDDASASLAAQMGSPATKGEPAPISERRFRRILEVDDAPELFTGLRRAVQILGRRANLTDLARAVYGWNDIQKRQWAYDYYDKAS